MCKKIIGFDANALYLGCIGGEMPTGAILREEPTESIEYYTKRIMNEKLFGFLEVDIYTPDDLKEKFKEFPPIFKNTIISYENLSEEMKKYQSKNWKSKSLISSYFGKKILLYTPLLKFYLRHGLKISKIHQIVKFQCKRPFKGFMEEVSNARREADDNPNKAIKGETMKLLGNSAFGKTILDKTKFNRVMYKQDEKSILKNINDAYFKDINEINNTTTEITKSYKKSKMDTPITIGLAIFSLAKLRMLEFVYDFLHVYIDDSDYQLIEMDTDSMYMAISKDNFEGIIKPDMKEEYEKDKHKWFVSNNFDRRTPMLFKIEWEGDTIIALNSKCYYCYAENDKDKLSSKGVQRSNNLCMEDYKNVLFNKENKMITNRGFRSKDNMIMTYESNKIGLTHFYAKRKVLADGITTEPLDI